MLNVALKCLKLLNVLQLVARDYMNREAQRWGLAGLCVCVVSNEPPKRKPCRVEPQIDMGVKCSLGLNNPRKVGELNGSLNGEREKESFELVCKMKY